jgi:hypothetical protein
VEALRMHGPARTPGEAGDAVLFAFRDVLAAQFLQPAGAWLAWSKSNRPVFNTWSSATLPNCAVTMRARG